MYNMTVVNSVVTRNAVSKTTYRVHSVFLFLCLSFPHKIDRLFFPSQHVARAINHYICQLVVVGGTIPYTMRSLVSTKIVFKPSTKIQPKFNPSEHPYLEPSLRFYKPFRSFAPSPPATSTPLYSQLQ